MSDKPLVKILSRDRVEFLGVIYIRSELERFAEKPKYSSEVLYHLGAKEVLRQMDEFEEQPKPKWELGTVLKGCSEIYRLDTFVSMGDDKQSEIWDFTDMRTGESLSGGAFPYKLYVIHRLPHEFKVGDWFSCEGEDGIFQCNGVMEDGFLICVGDFMQYKAEYCRHVPPPKKETAQSNQGNEAGTIFNYSRVKFGKFSDRQDESNLKKGWLSEVLTDAREKVNARPDWQKNRVKSFEEPKEEKLRRGWLDRQFTKVEQEVSEWSERMKVEAGFTPKPNLREVMDEASDRVNSWPEYKKPNELKSQAPKLFSGKHWDALDRWFVALNKPKVPVLEEQRQMYSRQSDLRRAVESIADELRRMKEGK